METKQMLYAAVGAPIVTARKVTETFTSLVSKVSEETGSYGTNAEQAIDSWAEEGRQIIDRLADTRSGGGLASKVDIDQARSQVVRLRDQLEDLLATWRVSFRPEEDRSA